MHAIKLIAVVILGGTLLIMGPSHDSAFAANCPTVKRIRHLDRQSGTVTTRVITIPCPPGSKPGKGRKGGPVTVDPCAPFIARPQPPKADPVWDGHTDGAIWTLPCFLIPQVGNGYQWRPAGTVVPVVTPAQLAQAALATLRLPKPVIRMSPGDNSDAGSPYTWVNLWTYYWTEPATWRPLSKTATAGGASATITVSPEVLTFDPGDRTAAVTCAGPGRPWTSADGNAAPSAGACGYRYRSVSRQLTATVAIRWAITWTGSDGTSGQLPAMTTQDLARFAVEQIQTVNR